MWKGVLLLCGLLAATYCQAQTVLKVAGQEGDERFFPLLSAVYQDIGVEAEFRLVPAERALALVNAGKFDAEVGRIRAHTNKYPQLFYTSEPLLDIQLLALTHKNSTLQLTNPQELRGKRIGFLLGMSVAQSYSARHGLKALAVPTHLQLAKMLELNRLDLVLMGSAFADSPVFQVAKPVLLLSSDQVFHIFHQQHAALGPQFDLALLQMKKDGRYQKLLKDLTAPSPKGLPQD